MRYVRRKLGDSRIAESAAGHLLRRGEPAEAYRLTGLDAAPAVPADATVRRTSEPCARARRPSSHDPRERHGQWYPGHMRQLRHVVAPTLLAALLAGCGGGDTPEQPDAPDPGVGGDAAASSTTSPGDSVTTRPDLSATTATATPTDGASDEVADAVAALQTAAAAVPNGQPFDLERGTEGAAQVWEVKVASNSGQLNLDVSADGSTVVKRAQESPDDDIQKLQSAQIDAVQALQTASSQQGGTLSEMEIDTTTDGTVIWQVDLRQPDGSVIEFNLDASSGAVIGQTADN